MIKSVKWFFVVLVFSSFISLSFSEERVVLAEKPLVGEKLPPLSLSASGQSLNLLSPSERGYTLLSFWASYDAVSRQNNAALAHFAEKTDRIRLISVSFDRYQSVFRAAVKQDKLPENRCFMETAEARSGVYKQLGLEEGFDNYLLDSNGVIVAHSLTVDKLISILEQ